MIPLAPVLMVVAHLVAGGHHAAINEAARRAILADFADRVAADSSVNDLEALRRIVECSTSLHAHLPPVRRADAITADLILVCTERKTNGATRSDGRYYRSGRFRDAGFAARYRDGSDQVRHVIWALRLLVRTKKRDAVLRVLDLRERVATPVNEKDLALNAAARAIADAWLPREGRPPLARRWPEILAAQLR
ncbi:MAG: hypothetical protein CMJ83_11990 [Planctomycetes bacterium]|nr:hypothetical protein [Planctomycetota bacterium]